MRVVSVSQHVRLRSQLRSTQCVFTDLGSLLEVAETWNERLSGSRLELAHARAQSFASGIECLILYEQVVCDSMFFEVEPTLLRLAAEIPGTLVGVFLDEYQKIGPFSSFRNRAAARVEEFIVGVGWDRIEPIQADDWQRAVEEDDRIDKRVQESADEPTAPLLVPSALDTRIYQELQEETGGLVRILPVFATRSNETLSRAVFYQELTRELLLPYSPGRNRAALLSEVLGESTGGVPQALLAQARRLRDFHKQQGWKSVFRWGADLPAIYRGAFEVPTLAEHVLAMAGKRGCTLGEAILIVRESKSAKLFRKEMAELSDLMLSPPAPNNNLDRRLTAINNVALKWAADLDEGIRYRTRTVRLEHVPAIGELLHSAGLDEWVVRDPIVRIDRDVRGLIFLNEVLRPE